MKIKLVIFLFFISIFQLSCGSPEPTKENAIKQLEALDKALDNKDYEKAYGYLKIPEKYSKKEVLKDLPEVKSKGEISKEGIVILAEKGTWGSLKDVLGESDAKRMAERINVPLDQCFGIKYKRAHAGFYWTGKQFKIIRFDDIGEAQ